MNKFFAFDSRLEALAAQAEENIARICAQQEEITCYNQQKVLAAFIKNGVSESFFAPSTGYGYNDRGRDALDRVLADIFECEDSIIRHNFVCGTHALTVALFGVLRPGDVMLSITGMPYDTLQGVIGLREAEMSGSLREFGIEYSQIDLLEDGSIDIDAVVEALKADTEKKIRMVYLQRSRGYSLRPSLHVREIEQAARAAKSVRDDVIVMVDNCYGEFVEYDEPVGGSADLMAGSLIKNPGGGIAPTGGYIAGRADLVEHCAYRLTTPGTGREVGCSLGHTRELYMGLFSAPHVTGEALHTARFGAELFRLLGFDVTPDSNEERADIIQSILLRNSDNLIAFCQGLQKGAPVDSMAAPVPGDMPGYDSQVIMAAGAFTLGSSIELSADAPLREPYAVWMQGGLNFHSSKTAVMLAAQTMHERGLITL